MCICRFDRGFYIKMKINILSLFPEMFTAITTSSILGKANQKGIIDVSIVDIRDYSENKHKKVDDYPYGGGEGMLMSFFPIYNAIEELNLSGTPIFYMSPRGKIIEKEILQTTSTFPEITILCGHYEGVDQRIIDYYNMQELSIGDYILTGGELPAMVFVDSLCRFIDGILGDENSIQRESVYSGLLEYPQYTKPRECLGKKVPEVLLNGNHQLIELWQYEMALRVTKENRPQMFEDYLNNSKELSKKKEAILKKLCT